jgi:sodium-independent sulfate anion transporter 11
MTFLSTRAAVYEVIINSLKRLPQTKLDAAWGLPGLFALYAIKQFGVWATKRWPRRGGYRAMFFTFDW